MPTFWFLEKVSMRSTNPMIIRLNLESLKAVEGSGLGTGQAPECKPRSSLSLRELNSQEAFSPQHAGGSLGGGGWPLGHAPGHFGRAAEQQLRHHHRGDR